MVSNSNQMGADGVILLQESEREWLVKAHRLIYIHITQALFGIKYK